MTSATAYMTFCSYVAKIINNRITDRDAASDVVQSVWLAVCQSSIPDDRTEAKRVICTIAIRTVISQIRTTLGQTGKRAHVNSGIVIGDTAEFILDQAVDQTWLANYPENLRYIASHLASGGSARDLYTSHGRYRVVQDFGALKAFCSKSCVQN